MSSPFPTYPVQLQQSALVEPSRKNLCLLPSCLLPVGDLLDSRSAVRGLSSCAASRNLKLGVSIHAKILKLGLDSNCFVGNSLLDMYAKCGAIEDARELFEQMPERSIVSWTTMMAGFCQDGAFSEALSIFSLMLESQNVQPNEHTLSVLLRACAQVGDLSLVQAIHGHAVKFGLVAEQFLLNSLLDAYAKSGSLGAAAELIERLSCRDVVAWTSVISGCVVNGLGAEALNFFFHMQEDGVTPNVVTILSILQACSLTKEWQLFQWVHGFIRKTDSYGDGLVMNSLTQMYSVNGHFLEGVKVLSEYSFTGEGKYLSPETMANLLQGCGHFANLQLAEQLHGFLIKHKFFPCTIIENSLINMYAENQQDSSAFKLFRAMSCRDIVSWNTMIACFVKNGRSHKALELFDEMLSRGHRRDGVLPDVITMLALIQACSNLVLLQIGQAIHGYITRASMLGDHFVQNALIDLYGKMGRLDFAEQVFKEMPERDLGSWNSMIAAYGIHGDGKSALRTFDEMIESGMFQPNAISFTNVLTATAHSGLLEEGLKIFNTMKRDYGVGPRMEHFVSVVDLLGRSGRLEDAETFITKMPVSPAPVLWAALLGACTLFGNVEIAERALERLRVLEPESNVWRVTMSNIYASVGKWENAAKLRAEMRYERLTKEGGWSSVEVKGHAFRFLVGDTMHPESKAIYKTLNMLDKAIREHCQKQYLQLR